MKIAFVSYDFGEYSIRHANALAALDDTSVLLVLAEQVAGPYRHLLSDNVDASIFKRPRHRHVLRQWQSIRSILRRIRAFQPDVVHFQGGHPWFNFALRSLRRYPLVLTAHNPRHHVGDHHSRKTPQWVMDFGYRQADQLIVHGEALKEQMRTDLHIPPSKVHAIPIIAMGTVPEESIAEDPHKILFFGRIWEYKGLEYLIKAEPLVRAEIPDARFVIAGEGEDFARYRDMMRDPSAFEIHNERVPDDVRERLFAESAVVVLPYIEATQSGVVPVAYRHGKPVIATRVGALPEVVLHEKTGLLIPSRDARAAADAIIRLLRDTSLRHQLGDAGRTFLQEQASDETIARSHVRVYQGCHRWQAGRTSPRPLTTAKAAKSNI